MTRLLPSTTMDKLPESPDHFETALEYRARGYRLLPCRPLTKVPAVKWTPFKDADPTEEDLWAWFSGTDNNVALITTGLVIFDVDDVTKAKLVLEHCGDTPYKVQTPSGGI